MGTRTGPRRRDALANRARILRVAREEFAQRGIDVPIAAIARRAGVGTATLYRHFPTRRVLVVTAFTDQLHACSAAIDAAAQKVDPWDAFEAAVVGVCAMQRADRGFTRAFLQAHADDLELDLEREQSEAIGIFSALAEQAKDAGRLRARFGLADLVSLLIAHDALLASFPGDAIAASQRFLAAAMGAWDTKGPGELPPRPRLDHVRWMP